MTLLDRKTMLEAFERLDRGLAAAGVHAEVYVIGGAVLCLVHEARPSTRDVDAWFTEPKAVRKAAQHVAAEMGLAEDWLNDAAKGFLPENAGFETWKEWPHLTVSVADSATLLAMKCAAARSDVDAADIRFLAARLGISSARGVIDHVTRFYPADRLPVRSRLLIEELFDERA